MKKTVLFCLLFALILLCFCACTKENSEPLYVPESIAPENREWIRNEENAGIGYALYNDMTAEIFEIEEKNPGSSLVIPTTFKGYTVTAIGKEVFRGTSFFKIELPETLCSIGDRAFQRCAIRQISIPDAVKTIGEEAFDNCLNLETIHFGSGLKEIPLGAFFSCVSLVEIDLPEGIQTIGEEAFASLSSLERISLPESLAEIGPYAFWSSGTNSLSFSIPSGVEKIGVNAFQETSWLKSQTEKFVIAGKGVLLRYQGEETNVALPEGVLFLSNAFDRTPVTTLLLPDSLLGICENALEESAVETIQYNGDNEEISALIGK